MQLSFEYPEPQILQVIFDGRLDIIGANEIDMRFNTTVSSSQQPVLIDLEKTSFLSSIGVRLLLGAAQALKRKGVYLAIVRPQHAVKEVLTISGIDQSVPVFETLEAGIAAAK